MKQIESLILEYRDTVAHCSARCQAETLPDYENLALALAKTMPGQNRDPGPLLIWLTTFAHSCSKNALALIKNSCFFTCNPHQKMVTWPEFDSTRLFLWFLFF